MQWIHRAAVLGCAVLVTAGTTAAYAQSPTSLPELPTIQRPSAGLPAQEAFRDWPGDEALSKPFWLPWTEAAFRRAEAFGRPVLFVMSPGWSRRAQRAFSEVYAVPAVGRDVNELYIAILVHPDLRPDLRERYQTGLWPVQVLLLPNGDPMVSQVNDRSVARPITLADLDPGRARFLLREGDVYWNRWSDLLYEVGAEWASREGPVEPVVGTVDTATTDAYAEWLLDSADPAGGGFGLAPKRIVTGLYDFGWIRRARIRPALERHARSSLLKLLASPLHDRERGGLHRMALEPEFGRVQYEKPLRTQIEWIEQLTSFQRVESDPAIAEALQRAVDRLLEAYAVGDGPGFWNAQVPDPTSEDGGGFWRGETDREPPFERVVLAGESARAAAAAARAARLLGDARREAQGLQAFSRIVDAAWRPGVGSDHSLVPANPRDRFLWSQADLAEAAWNVYQMTGDPRALEVVRDLGRFVEQNLRIADDERWVDHLPRETAYGSMRKPRYPVVPNVRLTRIFRRIAIHDDAATWENRGRQVLSTLCGGLEEFRENGIPIARAIEEYALPPLLVRLQGDRRDPSTRAFALALERSIAPWIVVVWEGGETPSATLEWRDVRRRVEDPAALDGTIRDLLGWIGEAPDG